MKFENVNENDWQANYMASTCDIETFGNIKLIEIDIIPDIMVRPHWVKLRKSWRGPYYGATTLRLLVVNLLYHALQGLKSFLSMDG